VTRNLLDPAKLSSPSAEQSVIGAVFFSPDVLASVELSPAQFYDPRNKAVWAAMRSLEARRVEPDLVTVEHELARAGRLEAIGGSPYLGELVVAVPTAQNVGHYEAIVRDRWMCREVLLRCAEAQAMAARGGEEGEELLAFAVRRLSELETGRHEDTMSLRAAARQEFRVREDEIASGKPSSVLATGFRLLDKGTGGGLPVGKPTLIGALPATGKSAFLLAMGRNVAGDGTPVAIFTYEDRWETWSQRVIAELAGVSVTRVQSRQRLTPDEENRLASARDSLERLESLDNVFIVHAHGWRVEKLLRRARALLVMHGVRMFAVDYMQKMPNPDPRQFPKRDQAVRENLRQLDAFAGEENVAVPVLWQLTREYGGRAKKGEQPTREDFGDSAAAEQYGKLMLALWEPPADVEDRLEVVIVKHNQGEEGSFMLPFDRPYMRIG
jgi:replicative DNA helicase